MQTSREDPAFSDVLYIEELIGPHTINTILPATLHAFRDHRRVQRTLKAGEQDAERALARLAKLGIDLGGNHRETAGRWAFTTFTRPLDGPVETSPRLPALDVYAKHRAFSR